MTVHVGSTLLLGFLLALVRTSAWVTTSPPFTTVGVAAYTKVGISAALALAVVGHGAHSPLLAHLPTTTLGFMGAVLQQALTGLVLGFGTNLLFSTVGSAGTLLDLATGLNLTAQLDPLGLQQTPVIGRLFNLVATMLLFASGGYLLLIEGLLESFRGVPLSLLRIGSIGALFTHQIAVMFLAALELAAPLLVVLFLSNVVLGLLTRAAPQLNVLSLSLGVQVMLGVLLVGVALPLLPGAVDNLMQQAVRGGLSLLGR